MSFTTQPGFLFELDRLVYASGIFDHASGFLDLLRTNVTQRPYPQTPPQKTHKTPRNPPKRKCFFPVGLLVGRLRRRAYAYPALFFWLVGLVITSGFFGATSGFFLVPGKYFTWYLVFIKLLVRYPTNSTSAAQHVLTRQNWPLRVVLYANRVCNGNVTLVRYPKKNPLRGILGSPSATGPPAPGPPAQSTGSHFQSTGIF